MGWGWVGNLIYAGRIEFKGDTIGFCGARVLWFLAVLGPDVTQFIMHSSATLALGLLRPLRHCAKGIGAEDLPFSWILPSRTNVCAIQTGA